MSKFEELPELKMLKDMYQILTGLEKFMIRVELTDKALVEKWRRDNLGFKYISKYSLWKLGDG